MAETIEEILERIKKYPDKQDGLHELTRIIYNTIPEMFDNGHFEPAGIEIHYGIHSYKIYAMQLAENMARKLLGLPVEPYKGDTWEDAQQRAGTIK